MNGFPRESRLRGGVLFLRLFRSGLKLRSRHFNIYFASSTVGNARLGIAVSKRYVGRAVDRNRIKRIVRESFRLHAEDLHHRDIVVQANSSAATTPSSTLFETLASAWSTVAQPLDR